MTRLRNALALLADIFGVISGVAALGGVLFGVGLLWLNGSLPEGAREALKWVAVAMLGMALGGGIAAVVASRRLRHVARGYRWESASYHFAVLGGSPEHHRATTTVRIKATRDNIRIFENRYLWTGSGVDPLPRSLRAGQTVLSPVNFDGNFKHYFVLFSQALARGEEQEIVIEQDFQDTGGTFVPYYAKLVVEPLASLHLRVTLPHGVPVGDVTLTVRRGLDSNAKVVTRRPGSFVGNVIDWTIEKPKLRHDYRIDWMVEAGKVSTP